MPSELLLDVDSLIGQVSTYYIRIILRVGSCLDRGLVDVSGACLKRPNATTTTTAKLTSTARISTTAVAPATNPTSTTTYIPGTVVAAPTLLILYKVGCGGEGTATSVLLEKLTVSFVLEYCLGTAASSISHTVWV